MSWNSRGSSQQKMQFMNHLVSTQIVGDKIPILCNQENFILKSNSYKIFQALPGFHCFTNPAIKDVQDRGRPKNGMFIAVPDSIKSFIQDVSPNHWRVQAVLIDSSVAKTLLINSCFPIDSREANENVELTETIEVIKSVIEANNCEAIVWVGDINSDFSRNTTHTKVVKEAVEDSGLLVCWDTFPVDFTCTYEREGTSFTSILDHMFMSEHLAANVMDAGVIHHHENSSDHEPVYSVLSSLTLSPSLSREVASEPRPSWKKASLEEKQMHQFVLDRKLEAIVVPTQISECEDLHCKLEEHIEAVDWFTTEVMEAIQSAGEETLPCPGSEKNKCRRSTPGFNEHVKQFKESSLFWSQVWKSAGCPLNTELHRVMKRARNKYHVEFKRCVKAENQIKKSKLLDACINGNGELFKEIKSMRKTKSKVAEEIDGVKNEIPNHFGNIYKELYNCVNDGEEIVKISEEVEQLITLESIKDVRKVTSDEVKKASYKLKPGKSDPAFTFSSDCVKVKSELLAEKTAVMIRSFLVHNHIPQFLLLSTLVPLVKDKLSSVNVSKNYRSVCITSLILKQVDWIILNLFGDALGFHDLQFAYQPGVSATMCTWAVLETINYFVDNGSEVFGCSMDKSKAFDRCKISLLFRKMMRNLSPVFLRLIIFMYVNQFSNVRWGSEVSSSFGIKNVVGQGKILAVFAFCYYCQDLFELLENSSFGCRINGVFAGAFGFSDDDIFLAPSALSLQKMLKVAEDYCENHGLKFSTDPIPRKSKTKCIAWLKDPRPLPQLQLCGNSLPWVNEIKHLGNMITNEKYIMKKDMEIKNGQFVFKSIEINQEFHFAAVETKLKVNEIYNASWFGSVLWDLFCPSSVKLESSWNRSVKIMMKLPYATHRGLIEPVSGRILLKRILLKRFLMMISSIRKSKKAVLKTILEVSELNTNSTTGHNLREIILLTGKSSIFDIEILDVATFPYHPLLKEEEWRLVLLEGLLEERESEGLDESGVEWLEFLCTD